MYVLSIFLLMCDLNLIEGLSGEGTDNGVNEESSVSPASAASVPNGV